MKKKICGHKNYKYIPNCFVRDLEKRMNYEFKTMYAIMFICLNSRCSCLPEYKFTQEFAIFEIELHV